MKPEQKATMSELLASIERKPYSKEFWEKINKQIIKENKEFEEQCRQLKIDPISGKSTMSYEQMNKRFTL